MDPNNVNVKIMERNTAFTLPLPLYIDFYFLEFQTDSDDNSFIIRSLIQLSEILTVKLTRTYNIKILAILIVLF